MIDFISLTSYHNFTVSRIKSLKFAVPGRKQLLDNKFNNTLKNNTIRNKILATTVFGSKKHSTTLLQAKTGKYECRNVTASYIVQYRICYISALVLTCFRLKKGRATFFSTRNNCCEFLAFYGVNTHSVIQSPISIIKNSDKRMILQENINCCY